MIKEEMQWTAWKKRFAWWTVEVNNKKIWGKTYYMRRGTVMIIIDGVHVINYRGPEYGVETQYGTILDVLKS